MGQIEDIWPEIQEAFAFYDRRLSPVCGPSRRKLIEQRLSEGYQPSDLISAIHGYVHFHEGLEPESGSTFNPRKWFDPDSVFKATRFDSRVELGCQGKWVRVDPKAQHEAAVKARQEAAQNRLDAARWKRDSIGLKAV